MPKKTRHSKLGRPEELSSEELLARFKALKQFLEDNWGRIGLKLKRARQPDKVQAILKLVPGVEWCTPFRDHAAACLLKNGTTKVRRRELALTRQQHNDTDKKESRLLSEYQSAWQRAEEATTALKVVISQFGGTIDFFPFFRIAFVVAKELGVEELTSNSNRLEASLQQAREERRVLKERLSSQEAWYARNEVVKFARSTRYEKTPTNFAKAMAGLPDYGWLHSLRRCLNIKDKSLYIAVNFQLFKRLEAIIKKTSPMKIRKVETRLRTQLLREDAASYLKAHFGPSWWYIEQAFDACVGKGISRSDLPYRLMAVIQDNLERGKTMPEQELAKRRQLV